MAVWACARLLPHERLVQLSAAFRVREDDPDVRGEWERALAQGAVGAAA
jgi:hypothetical protein